MKQLNLTQQDVFRGALILVDRQHAYRENRSTLLVPVQAERQELLLEQRARALFAKLMESIRGWQQITAVSAWRSREEQQALYEQSLRENGMEFTQKFVALPGHSEHETGLAIDVGQRQDQIDPICPSFPDSGVCAAFREKASQFGFIVRYPKGKECITGIAHEPWHFRYVGVPHADIMERYHLTLEEYLEFLKRYTDQTTPYLYEKQGRRLSVWYTSAGQEGDTCVELDESKPYAVSGDNKNGFVFTQWSVCHGHA